MENLGVNGIKKKAYFGKNITNLPSSRRKLTIFGSRQVLVVKRESSKSSQRSANLMVNEDFQKKGEAFEYRPEIFDYFSLKQVIIDLFQKKMQDEYMGSITKYMRQILIDWLIQLQQYFELNQQTFYLALAYLNAAEATH